MNNTVRVSIHPMKIGQKIKYYRKLKRWSQTELAEQCGWEYQSRLSGYERGIREPSLDDIETLAKALGVRSADLTDKEAPLLPANGGVVMSFPKSGLAGPDFDDEAILRWIPQISWTTAGHWGEVSDSYQPGDGERMIPITARVSKRAFALRVKGESMEPTIPNGSTIIVDPAREAQSGNQIVVRQNHDEEATVKTLVRDGGKTYLKADNPRWPPMIEMRDDAVICGVVVQVLRDLV